MIEIEIPTPLRQEIVQHANSTYDEVCGLLIVRDGRAERYERGRNMAKSMSLFDIDIDPELWFPTDGSELALVHSHPGGWPIPSSVDVKHIGLWAGKPYLIYSVTEDDLAGWTISDGMIAPFRLIQEGNRANARGWFREEMGAEWRL